jgi:hypothetical protein
MSEEEKVVEAEQAEEPAAAEGTVTEEIKVQVQDLFQIVSDIIHEGTAKRITIMRNDHILVDIPLAFGMAASVLLAMYMPLISAVVALGALLGGCTMRIERPEPPEEA